MDILWQVLLAVTFLVHCHKCLDIDQFYKYLSTEDSSNSECDEQKLAFLLALLRGEEWTLKSKP